MRRSYVLQSTNYCELDWGRCILRGKGDMKYTHIEPSFHTKASSPPTLIMREQKWAVPGIWGG